LSLGSSFRVQGSSFRLFQTGQLGYFLELEFHFADDGGGDIGIDIAATAVETSLDVGHREVREDVGQMLGEASLGAVGAEEAQTDEGIAQVGHFQPA